MMRIVSALFLFLVLLTGAQGQTNPYDKNFKVENQQAHFPKGDQWLRDYFFACIKYSPEAVAAGVKGSITLSFMVQTDSSLTEIMVVKGIGMGVDEAVIGCVKNLKYAPAFAGGVAYRSQAFLTVNVLAEERKTLKIEQK